MINTNVNVGDKEINLTNLDKEFWPGEGVTKAHLIKYYTEMAPYILPYIKNRPLVMKRYPDGVGAGFFYQKECPSYAPDWVESYPVRHYRKIVNYIICNDVATLVWLANQGCVEVHAWMSTVDNLNCPDILVMDLDPADGTDFSSVVQISLLIREVLQLFEITSFIKTSGASGLHIFIPVIPRYNFNEVTGYMKYIAELVVKAYPQIATVERSVNKRHGKIYIDYLQNGRGKTMAFPYSLRPLRGVPVSAPLNWSEVSGLVSATAFNYQTIRERLADVEGDRWRQMLHCRQSLDKLVNVVKKHNHSTGVEDARDNLPLPAY